MTCSKKDIEILIKMELLLKMNEKSLFGENGDLKYSLKSSDNKELNISKTDYVDFIALVRKMIEDKKKGNELSRVCMSRKRLNKKLEKAIEDNNIEDISKYSDMLEDF